MLQLVYVSAQAGRTAARSALKGRQGRLALSALPHVTFTDPAVAAVGLTGSRPMSETSICAFPRLA